ncbi:hypothetical protein L227DRAFT_617682 [Lentinus tigrinus ALCF2SS1-6]|uniref:Uncharacterized protein n=1 Tax=Lentinus tigrinus ALCF2SS1-6 TaxID=1328759 RepID=A0A5C2RQ17_9APHY|nr:hypothetical protein L227DRAFT_617682 [Lentinus tigrinus ALCF2SS1-6]
MQILSVIARIIIKQFEQKNFSNRLSLFSYCTSMLLVSVRKFLLDAISPALNDLPSSDNPESRYSRLVALSDLCHRLLTDRCNVSGKKASNENLTHIAKVDLYYPNMRNVISSVLRPLEHLSSYGTMIAMKMCRVSDKNKELMEQKDDRLGALKR